MSPVCGGPTGAGSCWEQVAARRLIASRELESLCQGKKSCRGWRASRVIPAAQFYPCWIWDFSRALHNLQEGRRSSPS